MRRVGDIMQDLGFREDAPEGAQKAFVKNLIRAAYGAEVEDLNQYREEKRKRKAGAKTEVLKRKVINGSEQLVFEFEDE